MRWGRRDREPATSEKIRLLKILLKPQATVIDHATQKVYSIERFKARLRKQA